MSYHETRDEPKTLKSMYAQPHMGKGFEIENESGKQSHSIFVSSWIGLEKSFLTS